MTQEELQKKIINLEKYIGQPNSVVTEGLLYLINQHVAEVIGELEGKPESGGKIICDCDCDGVFCGSLMHPCKKPDEHIPQRDKALIDIRNKLKAEQRKKAVL